MSKHILSAGLAFEYENLKDRINDLQAQLENIPDTFYALFWLYSHDFLYVSKTIENVLGHPNNNFAEYGMVFFQNIIPPHLISRIYETMNTQASQIENHHDYIFANEFLNIKAAIYNSDMQEVPVMYNAVLIDVKPFMPTSYLVLCSWIDVRDKDDEEINQKLTLIKNKLLRIKEIYTKSNPEHFKSLMYRNKLSEREKEVALLLMQGHSTKSISDKLMITFNTVESHRKNLLIKLGSKNTPELIHKLNNIPLAF